MKVHVDGGLIYQCPPFDLNDQALIRGAWERGEPVHVATALEFALAGFKRRIQAREPLPINDDGELVFMVIKPRNFFDKFVIETIIQDVCDNTGFGVALVKTEGPEVMKQPASPDVEFLPVAGERKKGV